MGPRTDGSEPAKPRRALKDIPITSGRTGRLARQATFGRIGVGSVLGRTFSIYGQSFVPIVLMSLLVFSPLVAYSVWALRGLGVGEEATIDRVRTWGLVYVFGQILLSQILAGPVTYNVVARLRATVPGFGDSMRIGLGRIPRILLTVLLLAVYGFCLLFVGGLVLGIPLGLLVGLLGAQVGSIVFVVIYAGALLWVLSVFWVAVPAAAVEDVGPQGALSRSVRLTRRNVWKVIAVMAALALVGLAVHQGIGRVVGGGVLVAGLVQVLVTAVLTGPLGAIAGAIAYHDLRTSAEGIDAATIARVFE
jgi:hypothetical protein